jgi:hypothetical protein
MQDNIDVNMLPANYRLSKRPFLENETIGVIVVSISLSIQTNPSTGGVMVWTGGVF